MHRRSSVFVLMRFELGRSLAVVGWALLPGVVSDGTGFADRRPPLAELRHRSPRVLEKLEYELLYSRKPGRDAAGACSPVPSSSPASTGPADGAAEPAEGTLGFIDRHARTFYSLLASVLLAAMLFYEVSGGVLTVAWGVEALAYWERVFRCGTGCSGFRVCSCFLICVLKLFLYDLRQLETINRILSFIVLGLILVSVSWIYTRFRTALNATCEIRMPRNSSMCAGPHARMRRGRFDRPAGSQRQLESARDIWADVLRDADAIRIAGDASFAAKEMQFGTEMAGQVGDWGRENAEDEKYVDAVARLLTPHVNRTAMSTTFT